MVSIARWAEATSVTATDSGQRKFAVVACARGGPTKSRPANHEVFRGIPPVLLEPGDVRFESASRDDDDRAAGDVLAPASVLQRHPADRSVLAHEISGHRIVPDLHPESSRRIVVGVDQCLSPAEKEPVGTGQVQRRAQRLLPLHSLRLHPGGNRCGLAHRECRQLAVRLPGSHPKEVVQELVLTVDAGDVGSLAPVRKSRQVASPPRRTARPRVTMSAARASPTLAVRRRRDTAASHRDGETAPPGSPAVRNGRSIPDCPRLAGVRGATPSAAPGAARTLDAQTRSRCSTRRALSPAR